MQPTKLEKYIRALASSPETSSPVISAFFDFTQPVTKLERDFHSWCSLTRHTFKAEAQVDFLEAAEEIRSWLHAPHAVSGAVFSRWGDQPLFLPLDFHVPLETSFHADDFAIIYPLVELRDRFDRFVVVLTTNEFARIVEVNLGETSLEVLTDRPALRQRLGREWTREHYANHRRDRERLFVKEKIEVLERLMAKQGHNALLIAGQPNCVARLRDSLPRALREKLVDEIATGFTDQRVGELMEKAVEAFLAAEREESQATVKRLDQAIRSDGLATVGVEATKQALERAQAECLVLSKNLLSVDREALLRLAIPQRLPVETVENSQLLDHHGGAGALLRYRWENVLTPGEALL
ncbi:MAG: host attachment protein [Verrucomicrobiota bacterium]